MVTFLYTTAFHGGLKIAIYSCAIVHLCSIWDQPDTTGSCCDISWWHCRRLGGFWVQTTCGALWTCRVAPSTNPLMQQIVFSWQIEDALQHASNQTRDDNEKWRLVWCRKAAQRRALKQSKQVLKQSKQVATMQAAMTNSINPHRRTMLILLAIVLLHKRRAVRIQRTYTLGPFRLQGRWYLWSPSLWAAGSQQASSVSFHTSTHQSVRSQARRTVW